MTACEHCGSTDPGHGEAHARVEARRATLGRWALGVVGAVALVGVVAAVTTRGSAGAGAGAWLALTGALGWAVAAAAGVFAAGLAHRPGSARGRSAEVSLALGALVTGALTPIVALAVASRVDGLPTAFAAVWAGYGWLVAGAGAHVLGIVQARVDLLDGGRRGERARAAARQATSVADVRAAGGVLVSALAFATWVAALAALPVLVVALVPLHVVLVAAARRISAPAQRPVRLSSSS